MSQIQASLSSHNQLQNEEKDDDGLNAYYKLKPFIIRLQNADIARIHSLQNSNALYLNGVIGKINGFNKEKSRFQVRIFDNVQNRGRTISIKEANLKPIFIQSLLPPNGFAQCCL